MNSATPAHKPTGLYDGMVDNLVTQFSSALDCFRELVQNSIDAGTPRVDVWMEYLPGEGHEGTIAIHVDDFGEGMDEKIIDNEFTQLFASTKDDDLTKIGKFGIGFVSVFALQPRAILVHTGRSGEYWEVFFHEDRSFSKTLVDNPVEGTQITLFLEGEYHRYQELAEQIPATLRHWCSHSEVEVTFEDRTNNTNFAPPEVINEDFAVAGECLQSIAHQGTEIVLAYSDEPIYGFYNRGLTLALTDVGDNVLERWKRRFEFISFKIKSRYLEHTLSRDSVIRDEQYEKAMTLVEEAANGPLLDTLITTIETLAAAESWSVEDYHHYCRLMGFLFREPPEEVIRHNERPIFRCLDSEPISLAQVWSRFHDDRRILLHHEATPLTKLLGKQGTPVLMGTTIGGGELQSVPALIVKVLEHKAATTVKGLFWRAAGQLRQWVGQEQEGPTELRIRNSLASPESVYFPIELDDKPDDEIAPLIVEALTLLKAADANIRRLATGRVSAAGDDAPFVMVAEKLGPIMARPAKGITESKRSMDAVINRNHPQFDVVLRVHRIDPPMAAYLLARGLLLNEDHRLDADQKMLQASLTDTVSRFE